MSKYKLRDYQETAVNKALDFLLNSKEQRGCIVAPVAAGKALLQAEITKRYKEKVLILQPNKELLKQNYDKFLEFGGEASIYSASFNSKEIGHVTYATLGSVRSIGKLLKKMGIKTLIIDEIHFGFSPEPKSSYRKFLKDLSPDKILGLTASPFRLSVKGGMDSSYSMLEMINTGSYKIVNDFIDIIPIKTMTDNRYWTPIKYDIRTFDDSMLELNSTGAEYSELSVKIAVAKNGVNNTIFKELNRMLKEGANKILVFCDSLETIEKFMRLFPDISAGVYSGMDIKIRSQVVDDFKSGKLKIIFNYGALLAGFDYPELDNVIMGRPTNSLAIWYQLVGRITRIHPDKKEATVLDLCNNFKKFGKIEDLEFHYIENHGHVLVSNNKVLTGVSMSGSDVLLDDFENTYKKNIGLIKESYVKRPPLSAFSPMKFGKHKGKLIKDLDEGYLEWFIKESKDNIKSKELRDIMVGVLEFKKRKVAI